MVGRKGCEEGIPVEPRPAPTPEAIYKMCMRDLTVVPPKDDPEQDQEKYNKELFVFFIDKLMPNTTGP